VQPPVDPVEVGAVLVEMGVVVTGAVVEPTEVVELPPLGTVHWLVPRAVAQSSVAPLA
jgi:hypothetical protein